MLKIYHSYVWLAVRLSRSTRKCKKISFVFIIDLQTIIKMLGIRLDRHRFESSVPIHTYMNTTHTHVPLVVERERDEGGREAFVLIAGPHSVLKVNYRTPCLQKE